MAHAERRTAGRRGGVPSPRVRRWPRSSMRSACWSRSRRHCWSWPRSSSCSPAWSSRYVFHQPLIWSDELASILFLWLAMLGAVVAFRRAEHMRMTAIVGMRRPRCAPFSTLVAICRGAGVSAADRLAGLRIRVRRELHHHAGAGDLQRLARRRAAGRHRPDDRCLRCCGWRAPAMLARSCSAPLSSVALVIAVFWLLQPLLRPLGNLNLLIFFVGVVGALRLRRRADRLRVRPRDLRLPGADHAYAADGGGRPHGRGHVPPHPAGGAAVRLPRPADRDDRHGARHGRRSWPACSAMSAAACTTCWSARCTWSRASPARRPPTWRRSRRCCSRR